MAKANLMAPNKQNGGDRGPWGPKQPDLEELLKRGQDKLKQVMPGGSGLPGSFMFLVDGVGRDRCFLCLHIPRES